MISAFHIYLLLSTLLHGAITMDTEHCFTVADRLYMIEGYAQYRADQSRFNASITRWESCMFNNTAFYYMSLVNISNVSNGTFVATFDHVNLSRTIATGGRFK